MTSPNAYDNPIGTHSTVRVNTKIVFVLHQTLPRVAAKGRCARLVVHVVTHYSREMVFQEAVYIVCSDYVAFNRDDLKKRP